MTFSVLTLVGYSTIKYGFLKCISEKSVQAVFTPLGGEVLTWRFDNFLNLSNLKPHFVTTLSNSLQMKQSDIKKRYLYIKHNP